MKDESQLRELQRVCQELGAYAHKFRFNNLIEVMTTFQDELACQRFARFFEWDDIQIKVVFTVVRAPLTNAARDLGILSIYGPCRKPPREVCLYVCKELLPRGATDATDPVLHSPDSVKYGGIV